MGGNGRITDDELAYHSRLIEAMKEAELAKGQIRELTAQVSSAQAAFRSWGEFLHDKYELVEGDGVDEHGEIVRGAQ